MPTKGKSCDRRVRKVLEIAQVEITHTVASLAERVNLSASHLEHLFKEHTGTQLRSFLNELRMSEASKLLVTTEMRIKEIAYHLDYQHPPSFVRAFKTHYEVTPGDFRRIAENAN
ncbi:MAG: AraC-like DNA-binding protein [Kiritimatiellia bacterium]|jgi:AraC-like DNA-binding protein